MLFYIINLLRKQIPETISHGINKYLYNLHLLAEMSTRFGLEVSEVHGALDR